MEESQSNGMHTDRPSDEEIQVPSGNGDGPPAEETEAEAEAPEALEPEAIEPEVSEPDAPAAEAEPEPEAPAAEAEPEPATVEEPPVADVPAIEIPAAISDEPVAEEPAAEPAVEEAVAEPAVEEPVVEVPAAEVPAAAEPAPLAAEIPAAAPGEPSPELAAAVEEALEGVEEDEPIPEWIPGDWFVVHTYAGYENKVKTNLETRVHSMNMEDKIYEVVIPMEDVMEIKSGKKQVVQRKVFPGYLLVRMELDDDSWYVVRNTPGVTGFVGSGTKPIPLSEKEVDRILQRKGVEEKPKPKIEYSPGDGVRVVAGPFANFQGVISEIDMDRSKLKVLVNIFGRETPVELGFDQVAKL